MEVASDTRREGFTLLELMIVVAIIGILASIAIPSFRNYQLSSKRAEAFANLGALAVAQKAYFAEYDDYLSSPPEPSWTSSVDATSTKRSVAPLSAAFADVGWTPDGDVFFDYDTATPSDPGTGACTCTEACFTASAYGDLDGDLNQSVVIYAHPDLLGQFCETYFNNLTVPLDPVTLERQFDMPAPSRDADRF